MQRLKENLSEASTKTYEGSCAALTLWLLQNKPQLLPEAYQEKIRQHTSDKEAFIKSTIFRNLKFPPIKFDEFSGHDFVAWLSTLKRGNGEWWTHSLYTNHRSGLYHLHMNYEVEVTEGFRLIVDDFFRILPKQKYDEAIIMKKRKSNDYSNSSHKISPTLLQKKRKSFQTNEQDTLCNEIVQDALKNLRKANRETSYQELRSSLKYQWKEKADIPHGEFKKLWKRVKKEVQHHLDNNS